jgi:hypothetical protein
MKKISTVAAKQSKKISQQKLTIGLDLGDRNSWYCVVDEAGPLHPLRRVTCRSHNLPNSPANSRFGTPRDFSTDFISLNVHMTFTLRPPARDTPHRSGNNSRTTY